MNTESNLRAVTEADEENSSNYIETDIHTGVQHVVIEDYTLPANVTELLRNTQIIHGSDMLISNRSSDHIVFVGKSIS